MELYFLVPTPIPISLPLKVISSVQEWPLTVGGHSHWKQLTASQSCRGCGKGPGTVSTAAREKKDALFNSHDPVWGQKRQALEPAGCPFRGD